MIHHEKGYLVLTLVSYVNRCRQVQGLADCGFQYRRAQEIYLMDTMIDQDGWIIEG